jgi:hypothetical protein
MAHQPFEVRSWPQHEVVVIRHGFAVIALACDLPEPVAYLARFHVHRSPCLPYTLADGGQDPSRRF